LSWQITPIVLTKAITDPDPAAAKRGFDAMMQMKKIDVPAIEAARGGAELSFAMYYAAGAAMAQNIGTMSFGTHAPGRYTPKMNESPS